MLQESIRGKTKAPSKSSWVSFLYDEGFTTEKKSHREKETVKLDLFEKGLFNELKSSDSIEHTLDKIVRMALAAEFGATFVKGPEAKKMIKTIVRGIKEDRGLRKSALMIADKFAN